MAKRRTFPESPVSDAEWRQVVAPSRQYVDPGPDPEPAPGRFDEPVMAPEAPRGREAARKIAAHAFKVLTDTAPAAPSAGPTFFDIYNAMRDASMPAEEKCLYFILASRRSPDGRIWASTDRLAAETGLHRRVVASLLVRMIGAQKLVGVWLPAPEPADPIGLTFADDFVADVARNTQRAWPSRAASGEA
jgi:hypothetical protein